MRLSTLTGVAGVTQTMLLLGRCIAPLHHRSFPGRRSDFATTGAGLFLWGRLAAAAAYFAFTEDPVFCANRLHSRKKQGP